MFEQLLSLPLFSGVSHARLAQIVGESKFHFLKYPENETIITAAEPCEHITFLLSGSVRIVTENQSGRFAIGQTLTGPAVISPDFLFGRFTNYPSTVKAIDSASILKISKADYINILMSDQVFVLNYLNMLSVNAQKSVKGLLSLSDGTLDERLAYWVIALTQPGSTDIRMLCRKRDLCTIFGVPRQIFDATLEGMKDHGLILSYDNTQIIFNQRPDLISLLSKRSE